MSHIIFGVFILIIANIGIAFGDDETLICYFCRSYIEGTVCHDPLERSGIYMQHCSNFSLVESLSENAKQYNSERQQLEDSLTTRVCTRMTYVDDNGQLVTLRGCEFAIYEETDFVALIDAFKNDYKVDSEPNEMNFYRILVDNNFGAAFPNIEITLRMYLVLMVANCTGERSFSKMNIIKNRLRTTMTQKRLAYLSVLSIESDLLREMDFEEIINDLASKKARKVSFT
ncbi:hypothetical protein NQ318_020625 [Aromia moschata]|uniref:HAT C-terminal dimerisation domain-containing protein n=1 Tax=Aromia moschata TaxID=1265417 RepID=A0AAV8Z116_9CUCU|nr:hypothetical protein NQ318_020625 [Aromia moschata]